MKTLLAILLLVTAVYAGTIGEPRERMVMPMVVGEHTVVVWDHAAQQWLSMEEYDHYGVYEFRVPAWNHWYWVGLWNKAESKYVFGKWIGHFKTE